MVAGSVVSQRVFFHERVKQNKNNGLLHTSPPFTASAVAATPCLSPSHTLAPALAWKAPRAPSPAADPFSFCRGRRVPPLPSPPACHGETRGSDGVLA